MDHHCPWINNCVGHKNHKFFLLFLIYATLGISYVLGLIVMSFIDALKVSQQGGPEDFLTIFGLTILATIMLPIGLAILMLLSWQLWLVGTNTTSIENEEHERLRYSTKREGKAYKHVNVYNLGSMANFRAVFGPQVLWWWLPTTCPGDGLTFKRDYRSLTGTVSKV
jgi:palmitoyltransferase